MIIGVTHDQDGRVVQRLSVSTKVSIGLPPNGDRNHPTKLDHFLFLRKKKSANRVEWEADPELTRHYGEQCRELHIMLIDDDIENVFPSSYAWWTATERKCWGDGTSATRRTAEKPAGQSWTQCGNVIYNMRQGEGIHYETIFRDETVGALDAVNGKEYVRMLRRATDLGGFHQVIFICHSPLVWELADRILSIGGGHVVVGDQLAVAE
jgi:hypothetical protein